MFIAPAGSWCYGNRIERDDRFEHVPYVLQGFAVVAYEVTGAVPARLKAAPNLQELYPYTKAYIEADGGLINGKLAIDYALTNLPMVDPARLFACGHSSAGGQALTLSWSDSRIRACCAYDSSIDIVRWWNVWGMSFMIPDLPDFAARKSSLVHAADFRCPVLIFHAEDDSVVPFRDAQNLYAKLLSLDKDVTLSTVPTGGHYQGMIQYGIPAGIQFMEQLDANPLPPVVASP